MSYAPLAFVYKFEVSLEAKQEKSVKWEFPYEWGRYQWIPELIYRSSESWLPFKSNEAIQCDIRKLKEGTSAELTLKNTSDGTETVTLFLLLHINDYAGPEKKHAHVDNQSEFMVNGPEGDLDVEFKLVSTEKIWKDASKIHKEIPDHWLTNASDRPVGALEEFDDFIKYRTSVFDIASSEIIITHQKTYATLYELERYLGDSKCDSLGITYVGIDTGENLISVCKFLDQSELKSKRINILWTKWDRDYAPSVVDYLKDSVLNKFEIDYTYNDVADVYNYPPDIRADVMIMTYVVPWVPNFLLDIVPYIQMILKHNSTLIVVNPPSVDEISRDYKSLNGIPSIHDWKHLYLEVASNKNPTPVHPLRGCDSTMFKFMDMENKPLGNFEHVTPLSVIEGQQNSYECWIKSFDSRKSVYERRQTDDLFEDLLRQYEAEDEVFYVDAMPQWTSPLSSPAKFTIAELKTHLSMIPEHSVRWKSINQRFKDIHSPIAFLARTRRRRITLFVNNADVLTRKEQINFCREVHDNYDKLRIVFVRKDWTKEDMKANRGVYPPFNRNAEELKSMEIASARVINWCLGMANVKALRDSNVVNSLSGNDEFSIYQVAHKDELIYRVDCFSIDYLRSVVNEVCRRESNLSKIILRVNQQDHTTTFNKNDWERFCNERRSP